MKKIACIYASRDNQTQKISHYLTQQIKQLNNELNIELIDVLDRQKLSHPIKEYHLVIFGAPIRYGKHLPEMTSFIEQHIQQYPQQKTAFFSVNLTARKPEKNTPETSGYTKKLFKQLNWKPNYAAVFAGKLHYAKYRFFDKHMIRFIMWITKGPTQLDTEIEFTDWKMVDHFAQSIANDITKSSHNR